MFVAVKASDHIVGRSKHTLEDFLRVWTGFIWLLEPVTGSQEGAALLVG
jgi:hypothetical protein